MAEYRVSNWSEAARAPEYSFATVQNPNDMDTTTITRAARGDGETAIPARRSPTC